VAFSEEDIFHNPLKIAPKPRHGGLIRFKISDDENIRSLVDEIDEFLKREKIIPSNFD
jgi:hypothetical protein